MLPAAIGSPKQDERRARRPCRWIFAPGGARPAFRVRRAQSRARRSATAHPADRRAGALGTRLRPGRRDPHIPQVNWDYRNGPAMSLVPYSPQGNEAQGCASVGNEHGKIQWVWCAYATPVTQREAVSSARGKDETRGRTSAMVVSSPGSARTRSGRMSAQSGTRRTGSHWSCEETTGASGPPPSAPPASRDGG